MGIAIGADPPEDFQGRAPAGLFLEQIGDFFGGEFARIGIQDFADERGGGAQTAEKREQRTTVAFFGPPRRGRRPNGDAEDASGGASSGRIRERGRRSGPG